MRALMLPSFLTNLLLVLLAIAAPAQTLSGVSLGPNANLNGWIPFSADTGWNQPITSAAVDSNSASILGSSAAYLHHDFGNYEGSGAYGIPYVVVDSSIPGSVEWVNFYVFDSPGNSDIMPVPLPIGSETTLPVEDGLSCQNDANGNPTNNSGDAHANILDRATGLLYETYITHYCPGQWQAGNLTVWNTKNNTFIRPYGFTSADVSGSSVLAGLVKKSEVDAGVINHAIRFTMPHTPYTTDPCGNNGESLFTGIANHGGGNNGGSSSVLLMPGDRIRLKASFDISSFNKTNQVILTAMKTYGMIMADNGGVGFFSGTADPGWDDDNPNGYNLNQLGNVGLSNFELIQRGPIYSEDCHPSGAAPTISAFSVNKTGVYLGDPVAFSLTSSVSNYDYVKGASFTTNGAVSYAPTQTTTYYGVSTNLYGRTTSAAINVTVTFPPFLGAPIVGNVLPNQ